MATVHEIMQRWRLRRRIVIPIAVIVVCAAAGSAGWALTASDDVYVEELGVTVPADKAKAIEQSTPPGGAESETVAPAPTGQPDEIPAHILSEDAPVPISAEILIPKNAWLVSDGKTLVAVYAGSDGHDAETGRFVIVRQDLLAGEQTQDVVDVPNSGAVHLTSVPTGADVETSAQTAKLGFRGESGTEGTLDLAKDVVVAGS